MKKFIYSTLVVLAGLCSTSCLQDHIEAVYDPSKVVAQDMNGIQGCALDEKGADIEVNFRLADFGANRAVTYALYICNEESFGKPSKLSATITTADGKGTASFSQKSLNSAILNYGGEADVEFPIYFRLTSYLANDKASAIESTATYSNVVSASFIPYNAEILDVDKYPHVWVIGAGASVGSWSHDKVYQYLYDYDETGHIYTGVIDYGEDTAKGWKMTSQANWDDANGNWGSPDQGEPAEPAEITIVSGNASKDIKCYSKRFYRWSFDKNALKLTCVNGFNNVGLVGTINDWNPADPNLKMEFNSYRHRFFLDYEFTADAQVKFTCDDAWDINWGAGCVPGGDNIAVTPGKYRVYLDLNHKSIEFSTSMYGKDEPGPAPEPEPTYQGWGIIGSFNEWAGDVEMKEDAGVWTGYLNLLSTDQFKLRKDADWAENAGAPGDVEPFVVTLGEAFEAVTGGKNMAVAADGFYKLVYDTNLGLITVSDGTVWGVIGSFNEWAADEFMTLTDGKWVSPAISLKANEGFKIRKNSDWSVNRGATGDVEPFVVNPGEAFSVVDGGKNLAVPADGDYIITYDPAAETIVVDKALPENQWSLIGEIAGSSWNKDFYMTEVISGIWVSDEVELAAGKGFKVRFNNDWGVNRGPVEDVAPLTIGVAPAVCQDGKNISVNADGKYKVVYDANQEIIYLLGWSVIGKVEGSEWNVDFPMFPVTDSEGTSWASPALKIDGDFKLRYAGGWDVNRGAEGDVEPYVVPGPDPFKVVNNGKNLGIDQLKGSYYRMVYNEKSDQIAVINASWSVIGEINGTVWNSDVPMYEIMADTWVSEPFSAQGGFKIRFNRDWTVNRGAAGDADPYVITLGATFDSAQDGKNLKIEDPKDTYSVLFDKAGEKMSVVKSEIVSD